ncbi:bone morphogenetic protein 8A-like isoform X1 [Branchiostoma floridae]|uniref:Bone morphogenetic protein 8A-like isoform X1 n=1 Tax=Branchiostoma floridae TaxID=7739 RepID=A0A9J7MFK0_BRAFL|nr:bone morphogenetic protein 8A-like isoform X1 [Branchiostoma floridae]
MYGLTRRMLLAAFPLFSLLAVCTARAAPDVATALAHGDGRQVFEQILNLNSRQSPARERRSTNPPRYLLYVYKNFEKRLEEDSELQADQSDPQPDQPGIEGAQTIFRIRTFSPDPGTSKVQTGFLNFRLADLEEMPTYVELVLTRRSRSSPDYPLRVAVHEIDKDGKVREEALEWKILRASKLKKRGYDVFRVAKSVKTWLTRTHAQEVSDIGFQIRVTTRHGSDLGPHVLRDLYQLSPGSRGPALMLYFGLDRPELLHRRKSKDRKQKDSRDERSTPETQTSGAEAHLEDTSTATDDSPPHVGKITGQDTPGKDAAHRTRRDARGDCRLREWQVDFADLQWNGWIVHPTGYKANYCAGTCPTPLISKHLNASNHAFLRNLIRQAKPSKHHSVPKPCCTPTKLSPISVLYREKTGAYVVQKMNSMRAEACGCL